MIDSNRPICLVPWYKDIYDNHVLSLLKYIPQNGKNHPAYILNVIVLLKKVKCYSKRQLDRIIEELRKLIKYMNNHNYNTIIHTLLTIIVEQNMKNIYFPFDVSELNATNTELLIKCRRSHSLDGVYMDGIKCHIITKKYKHLIMPFLSAIGDEMIRKMNDKCNEKCNEK